MIREGIYNEEQTSFHIIFSILFECSKIISPYVMEQCILLEETMKGCQYEKNV